MPTCSRGIKDALTGGKPLLSDQELQEAMLALQKELQGKQQELMAKQAGASKAIGEKNKKEGDAFLAANAKKPGIKTLPSGLQYKVIKEGTGPIPKATDEVKTNYRGTLIDGTEFDSSETTSGDLPGQRGDPRLDRGPAIDEGGLEVAALHPRRARLRRESEAGRGDRARTPPSSSTSSCSASRK